MAKNYANEHPKNKNLSTGDNTKVAVLKGAALLQYRTLQKKKAYEEYGGEKFTPKDHKLLDKLKKRQKEKKVYKLPILTS